MVVCSAVVRPADRAPRKSDPPINNDAINPSTIATTGDGSHPSLLRPAPNRLFAWRVTVRDDRMQMSGIDELFAAEYGRLVRSLGVAFDPVDAADAVQEAFVQADRIWETSLRTYTDPAGWVRRVAINRLLNGERNRRRREEILMTIRPVADADLAADLLDLRRAVAALPDRMRAAVCLHYLADLSVAEVAVARWRSPRAP